MKFEELTKNLYENEETVFYQNGVYISLNLTEQSKKEIRKWQEKYLKYGGNKFNEELHVTLIYSKEKYEKEIESDIYTIPTTVIGYDKFGDNKECLVAKLKSEELLIKHKTLMDKYGFIYDYDEYQPHVTLSYNAEDIDINALPLIDFTIELEDETIKSIKSDKELSKMTKKVKND